MARDSKMALQIAKDWEYGESTAYQKILDDLRGATIFMGEYTYESYEGSAMVVFEKDGVLYETNGGHCSCRGLEGQWSPEVTTIEALEMRNPYQPDQAAALKKAIRRLKVRRTRTAKRALEGEPSREDSLFPPHFQG